jgi:hypothetical protein
MELMMLSIAYVATHLVLYVVIVRKRQVHEAGIFLFHAGSFLVFLTMLLGITLFSFSGGLLAGALAGVSVHAIYSLSFLELWALSDGSLSLRIMADVAGSGRSTRADIIARNHPTSDKKKQHRMETLMRLGLARKDGCDYHLTGHGRLLAAIFAAIAASADIHESG